MTVWIDADSSPTLVREHVIKYSSLFSIPVHLVANKNIPSKSPYPFTMTISDNTKDSADNYILENARESDLIITKDILFAKRALEKNITTINDRGDIFSKDTIDEKIEERNYNLSLSMIGFKSEKRKSYGKQEFVKFAKTFEQVFQKLRKNK